LQCQQQLLQQQQHAVDVAMRFAKLPLCSCAVKHNTLPRTHSYPNTHRCCCHTAAGVTFMTGKVDSVSHGDGQSTVKLQDSDSSVSGTLVLDATGHSRRLVQFDKKFDPGYQGAYGIIAGATVVQGVSCLSVL
jgi:hypothetical protein